MVEQQGSGEEAGGVRGHQVLPGGRGRQGLRTEADSRINTRSSWGGGEQQGLGGDVGAVRGHQILLGGGGFRRRSRENERPPGPPGEGRGWQGLRAEADSRIRTRSSWGRVAQLGAAGREQLEVVQADQSALVLVIDY